MKLIQKISLYQTIKFSHSFSQIFIPYIKTYQTIFTNKSNSIELKVFPIEYNIEYNSNHPYNRNNGTMIPNRGYQHIIFLDYLSKQGL